MFRPFAHFKKFPVSHMTSVGTTPQPPCMCIPPRSLGPNGDPKGGDRGYYCSSRNPRTHIWAWISASLGAGEGLSSPSPAVPVVREGAAQQGHPVLVRSRPLVGDSILPTLRCSLAGHLVVLLRVLGLLLLEQGPLLLLEPPLVSCSIPPKPLCSPAALRAVELAVPAAGQFSCSILPKLWCNRIVLWATAVGVLPELVVLPQQQVAGLAVGLEVAGNSGCSKLPKLHWDPSVREVCLGHEEPEAVPTVGTCFPSLEEDIGVVAAAQGCKQLLRPEAALQRHARPEERLGALDCRGLD